METNVNAGHMYGDCVWLQRYLAEYVGLMCAPLQPPTIVLDLKPHPAHPALLCPSLLTAGACARYPGGARQGAGGRGDFIQSVRFLAHCVCVSVSVTAQYGAKG